MSNPPWDAGAPLPRAGHRVCGARALRCARGSRRKPRPAPEAAPPGRPATLHRRSAARPPCRTVDFRRTPHGRAERRAAEAELRRHGARRSQRRPRRAGRPRCRRHGRRAPGSGSRPRLLTGAPRPARQVRHPARRSAKLSVRSDGGSHHCRSSSATRTDVPRRERLQRRRHARLSASGSTGCASSGSIRRSATSSARACGTDRSSSDV